MLKWLCDLVRPTNFGDFRHSGRGDKTFSIYHVISNSHVFKGLSEFIGGSLRALVVVQIIHLTCLVTLQDHMTKIFCDFIKDVLHCIEPPCKVCGNITYLTCHLTLQDYVIKGPSDVMEESSSLNVTILTGLAA